MVVAGATRRDARVGGRDPRAAPAHPPALRGNDRRDLVGRLGGDEFLLVCSGVESPAWTVAIAKRARDAFHHPVALAKGKVDVRTSIGVAWPGPDTKAETLVAQADTAMYESKRRGNGEPVLYADIAETAQVHGSASVKSSRLV